MKKFALIIAGMVFSGYSPHSPFGETPSITPDGSEKLSVESIILLILRDVAPAKGTKAVKSTVTAIIKEKIFNFMEKFTFI